MRSMRYERSCLKTLENSRPVRDRSSTGLFKGLGHSPTSSKRCGYEGRPPYDLMTVH